MVLVLLFLDLLSYMELFVSLFVAFVISDIVDQRIHHTSPPLAMRVRYIVNL